MKNKILKSNKAITLIALVITIIILLLLAGISISMISGQDGILNKATNAKEMTAEKQKEEKEILGQMEDLLNRTQFYGEVVDSGKCGENLNWDLTDKGILHIYGTGAMYDYVKYSTPSPWYKYRNEPYISEDGTKILNPDGTEYLSTNDYYANNPNGYKINSVIIDEGVTYLGDWAFYRICVKELTIPEGVESTGHFCIRYSPTLKKVNLPNSLKTLGDFGISRNQVLTTINFGNSLERIGTAGLASNQKLESAILPETVVSINEQLDEAYSDVDYSVQGLLADCTSLKTVNFGSVEKISQRTCINNVSLVEVIIPNTASSVDKYAFSGCTSLEKVEFEEQSTCSLIEAYAFYNCTSLKSITGGIAIATIESNAFNSTSALTEFEFSNANTTFGSALFYQSSLKTATIGTGVTVIPVSLFQQSALESLYISNSVTEIQSAAVHTCLSLADIYYDGTLTDWNNITRESNWINGTPTTCVVHFSDGTTSTIADCK